MLVVLLASATVSMYESVTPIAACASVPLNDYSVALPEQDVQREHWSN